MQLKETRATVVRLREHAVNHCQPMSHACGLCYRLGDHFEAEHTLMAKNKRIHM